MRTSGHPGARDFGTKLYLIKMELQRVLSLKVGERGMRKMLLGVWESGKN